LLTSSLAAALEKRKEAYEAEKAELGDQRQQDLALQELHTSIAGYERKLQLSAVSLVRIHVALLFAGRCLSRNVWRHPAL
jgi:hypothetical protein